MQNPAFQLREFGERQGEFGIQLNGPFIKLLGLFQLLHILKGVLQIVRLDKGEIRFAILSRFSRELLFLNGGKLCLQLLGDLLRQISLNGEHVR